LWTYLNDGEISEEYVSMNSNSLYFDGLLPGIDIDMHHGHRHAMDMDMHHGQGYAPWTRTCTVDIRKREVVRDEILYVFCFTNTKRKFRVLFRLAKRTKRNFACCSASRTIRNEISYVFISRNKVRFASFHYFVK
jgi:hypothetical protein